MCICGERGRYGLHLEMCSKSREIGKREGSSDKHFNVLFGLTFCLLVYFFTTQLVYLSNRFDFLSLCIVFHSILFLFCFVRFLWSGVCFLSLSFVSSLFFCASRSLPFSFAFLILSFT